MSTPVTEQSSTHHHTDKILLRLCSRCVGCDLLYIADDDNWDGHTINLPVGAYPIQKDADGDNFVRQDALCRFQHLDSSTLCVKCAKMREQLARFGSAKHAETLS